MKPPIHERTVVAQPFDRVLDNKTTPAAEMLFLNDRMMRKTKLGARCAETHDVRSL